MRTSVCRFFVGLAVASVAATAPLPAQQQSQGSLTVSVVVQPSCIVRTAPADAGRVAVELTCAASTIERARLPHGQPLVARQSGTARTTVLSGSLLQIDF